MKRLADVVRGVLAALVLVALLFGVPMMLRTSVANPWPGRDALELRDERAIVTGVLGALIWVVWIRFAITVGVELGHQTRWVRDVRAANRTSAAYLRPVRVEPLPAATGGLAIAAQRLIATVLLLIPLMTKSPRAVEAAPPLPVVAPADPSGALAEVDVMLDTEDSFASARQRDNDVQITVAPTDTLRSLANEHFGDPSRWREIFDLNVDRVQVDGRRLATPSALRVGWQLKLPAEARVVRIPAASPALERYRVEQGDNLWMIAEHHLTGELGRAPADAEVQRYWLRLIDANHIGLMSGDPNLIYPGEQFVLPQCEPQVSPPERAERERAAPDPVDAERGNDDRQDSRDSAAPDGGGNGDQQGKREPARRETHRSDSGSDDSTKSQEPGSNAPRPAEVPPMVPATPLSSESSSSSSSTTHTVPAPTGPGDNGEVPTETTSPDAPAPVGVGVAALSAGVLGVLEALRRQRLRAARVRSRLPSPPPSVVDTERRLRSVVGVERSARIDLAVRSAAASMVSGEHRLCALIVDGDGAIALIADGPVSLGEPWRSISTTSDRWGLPASVPLEALAATARAVGAPCPALVAVGMTASGSGVYADPESLGTLYVDADATTADMVVTGIATALASSVLAEAVQLIGVGVDPSCFVGSVNHQMLDSVDAALDLANELLGCPSTVESTFRLRARRTGGEEWQPVVVVVGASHGDAVPVEHRPGLAVIVARAPRDHRCGLTLAAGAESWHLEPFGIALTPLGVNPEELLEINELLEFERESVDADGSHDDSPAEVANEPVEPACTNGFRLAIETDTGTVDVTTNGKAVSSAASTISMNELQRDLTIRLFGLIDVVDGAGRAAEFGRSKSLELLAWIGAHRDGATRLGARSALWEVDVRDTTFANVVSEARRATARLRSPPDGEDWIARTLNSSLVLHERIVTDVDVVDLLLDRARQEAPAEATVTLRAAVEQIRGMPFAESGYLWPDAEGITSRLVVLATACCCELAELLLEQHDIEGVFWATGQGLKVLPGHEELIAYRMRAHGRAGDRAGVRHEWEAYERVLLGDAWSDGEPAPRLVRLRQELLSTAALSKTSVAS